MLFSDLKLSTSGLIIQLVKSSLVTDEPQIPVAVNEYLIRPYSTSPWRDQRYSLSIEQIDARDDDDYRTFDYKFTITGRPYTHSLDQEF